MLVLASVLVGSQSAITRPDEVLNQLKKLEQQVSSYQSSVLEQIQKIRASNGELTADYFNKTLVTVEENIKIISESDAGIRESLDAQKQTACIINLVDFVDQIVEFSGYAISNCIEVKDSNCSSLVINKEFRELLDNFERDVTVLSEIIVNALIGRNIFTEGDAIIERVQEQLKAKTAEFDAVLTKLSKNTSEVNDSLIDEISSLKTCFVDANGSTKSGIAAIQMQIPICIKFSGRGARSAPILPFEPSDFFPQLK